LGFPATVLDTVDPEIIGENKQKRRVGWRIDARVLPFNLKAGSKFSPPETDPLVIKGFYIRCSARAMIRAGSLTQNETPAVHPPLCA
jgi:hypothetical protein